VNQQQRHTRAHPCPICGGWDSMERGKGTRCSGFTSEEGDYAHCSREELARGLGEEHAGTYAHRLQGPCNCGTTHGAAPPPRDEVEAVYRYTDELGATLFEVVRKTGKKFLQRTPDGAGGYVWKLNGVRRVIYRLAEVLADDGDRPTYIVEGEKDCDNLWRCGHVATCNPGGAGKWSSVANVARTALQGRPVVVIADGDDVGRAHAREVADSLREVARSIRIVECPSHKDVSDHLAYGGTLEQLVPLREVAPHGDGPARLSLPDRARAWSSTPVLAPVTTGFPTLDAACRGGFQAPRVVVLGGAPGAAKTTTGVNIFVRAARMGHPAAAVASDEDIDDVMVRIGQIHGIDRYALEHRQAEACEQLAAVLEQLPNLAVFDGDEDTVEAALEWLAAHAVEGKAGVLLADSAQTIRTARSESFESPRERVDDVMKTIKRATRVMRLVSIVTSEISRAFYKYTKGLAELNDLAAFKESGGIEYIGKTCLLMRNTKGSDDLFDVGMPKNRGGKKRVFRLRIDLATTLLTEVIIPAEELDQENDADGRRSAAVDRKTKADGAKLRRIIAEDPGIGSRKLRDKSRLGPVAIGRALAWLEDEGRVENRPEAKGSREDPHYFAVQAPSTSDQPSEEAVA
jgi:KaiC/GvpD/RAD55 family RecA-like ATPase